MKEPPPAPPSIAPPAGGITRLTRTPHAARIDRSASRRADTEYCDGTGPILWGQSLPGVLALPSPHPLAVDSPKSRRQGVLGPELPPVDGIRGVRHRGPRRRDRRAVARRLMPTPGEPGDETWGDVPYEDRVHEGSWTASNVDLDLNLVFIGTSSPRQPRSSCGGRIENTRLHYNSTFALDADPARSAGTTAPERRLGPRPSLRAPARRHRGRPRPDAVAWINPAGSRARSGG